MQELAQDIKQKIDFEIEGIINKLKLSENGRKMLSIILDGGLMEDAAGDKSKQWAQSFFSKTAMKIWAEVVYTKTIIAPYIEESKTGKVYIRPDRISDKYVPLLVMWLKDNGLRKRGEYLTSDEEIAKMTSPKRGIYQEIKEKGLPVSLGSSVGGKVSKMQMLVDLSEEGEWVISSDNKMVIANSKISFFANFCHYRDIGVLGMWKIYYFFCRYGKDYLRDQKIDSILGFLNYVRVRKHDVKCIKFQKLSKKYGKHTIWEVKEIVEDGKEVEVIKLIIKSESLLKG